MKGRFDWTSRSGCSGLKAGRGKRRGLKLTLFEKPSLRTRVSLEVGMHQMGGQAEYGAKERQSALPAPPASGCQLTWSVCA